MKSAHLRQGSAAEAAAEQYLQKAGLIVKQKNYSCRHGEIDLVMEDGNELVFFEVRYRRGDSFGGPAASIDHGKQQRLKRSADHYLQTHNSEGHNGCRFDVMAVSGSEPDYRFDWVTNAFW